VVHGYVFGLKSADNSVENVISIEKKHNIQIPIVSLIFDPRNDTAKMMLNTILAKYGSGNTNKILHLTLSPNVTAKEVTE
jgi:cytochrome oxidase Cu insertion factor (SCO1/SenC/PrrC family)